MITLYCEKGSPCIHPLSNKNIQIQIHFKVVLTLNYYIEVHEKEVKQKKSINNIMLRIFCIVLCSALYHILILYSCIYLLFRKPISSFAVILSSIFLIRYAHAIFYEQFKRIIGLHFLGNIWLFRCGIHMIAPNCSVIDI